MGPFNLSARTLYIGVISILLLSSFVLIEDRADAAPPGTRESIWITIDIDFLSILDYDISAYLEVYSIDIEGEIYNTTDLRDLYTSEPVNLTENLDEELLSRTMNLTEETLEGDELSIVSNELDLSSLSNTLTEDDPVLYTVKIRGRSNSSRFLSGEMMDDIDEDRMEEIVSGLLLSGFHFSRTVNLKAGTNKRVTYLFPDEIDPLGDGGLTISLSSSEYSPVDGEYRILVDGEQGTLARTFPFKLVHDDPVLFLEEAISGSIELDWFQLDTIDMEGSAVISSVDINERGFLDDLPGSMVAPDFLGSGTILWAFSEGLLDDGEIAEIEEDISYEVEDGLSGTFDGQEPNITTVFDSQKIPETVPASSTELMSLISGSHTMIVDFSLDEQVELDVLEGYELEDVMDLLHGGLVIRRDMSSLSDDRFDVDLMAPVNLMIIGEEAVSTDSGRRSYDYSGGLKEIASDMAPDLLQEKVTINSRIDLTEVSSTYVSDLEMTLSSESTIDISVIEYDPSDFELDTDLDYRIDHLSSDMIRLLLKMGIAEETDITSDIEERVVDLLSGMINEEDLEISVLIDPETKVFTRDGSMDGELPISINIHAGGKADPLGSTTGSMSAEFIPFHMDPIIPIRTIEKNIDIGSISRWDPVIEVHFPSGAGIRAWIGNDSVEKVSELEVRIEDGHPVLILDETTPEGDVILLELEVGPYFGFNHVTICFFSFWGVFGFFLLLFIILIIRAVVKRKKKRLEEGAGTENDDEDDPDAPTSDEGKEEDGHGEELKW